MNDSLKIRPLAPDDWRAAHAICTQREVARWLGGLPSEPPESWRKRLSEGDADRVLRLVAESGGEVVGLVSLEVEAAMRARHSANLWLAVDGSWQGKGVGRALLSAALDSADRWLDLVRIEVDADAENVRAIHLLEKQGFALEARRRMDILRDGKLVDVLAMARIRPGWSQPAGALRPPGPWPEHGRRPPAEVIFRPPSVEDAVALAEVFRDPSVLWGTMQLPGRTESLWRKRLETNAPELNHLTAAVVDGRVAGMVGLHADPHPRRRHLLHLGMGVSTGFQGMGIGNRLMEMAMDLADRWLGARRVDLEVYADNLRAIRLYEKHGFIAEGTKRFHVFRDGGYVDSVVMGRTR